MNYCSNCGNKVGTNDIYCLNCGVKIRNDVSTFSNNSVDNGGFVWGLLGFCVPIAGLILFLAWKNEKPITAKAAGKGALIRVILNFVLIILVFVFAFCFGFDDNAYNNGYYNDDYYENYYDDLLFD